MLEDIPNPFNEVVNRQPRPSHSPGRHSPEGPTAGRVIVPVPATATPGDTAELSADHHLPGEPKLVARITTAPGPGEVMPPRWWAGRSAGPRPARQEADSSVGDADTQG